MRARIDVIYAANMQPGDLYAADVVPESPTRPVHDWAAPHEVVSVVPYTDETTGRRMLQINATHGLALTPVPIGRQVIVIRTS